MILADTSDIPKLLEMGRKFHESVQPEWPWSAEGFSDTMDSLIHNGFVAMTARGFISGLIAPMPLNPDWLVAHEILWWSEDGKGWPLMRAFREWAETNDADEIKWSCRSTNERVQRFYSRFSEPCETVYSEKI